MAKRVILGEVHDILRAMTGDQLMFFYELRHNAKLWEAMQSFVKAQKEIKLDHMYRLRRPKSQDDLVSHAMDKEYLAGRIAGDVAWLQIAENAGEELERRERASEKKKA